MPGTVLSARLVPVISIDERGYKNESPAGTGRYMEEKRA